MKLFVKIKAILGFLLFSAVAVHAQENKSGFSFLTAGQNRREPAEFDGFSLVKFLPENGAD